MSLPLEGKTALIFGVASESSIAWAIAKTLAAQGADIILGYQFRFHSRIKDFVPTLAKVIRYDRRGFGESSGKPDFTADPADLKALLETLGHPRAHILGHSQGGGVALTFAVRYPEMVEGLILFGTGPPAGFGLALRGEAGSQGDGGFRSRRNAPGAIEVPFPALS